MRHFYDVEPHQNVWAALLDNPRGERCPHRQTEIFGGHSPLYNQPTKSLDRPMFPATARAGLYTGLVALTLTLGVWRDGTGSAVSVVDFSSVEVGPSSSAKRRRKAAA